MWKLIGYKLKSEGLDELFFGGRDDGEVFKTGGLAAWCSRQARATVALKRYIAVSRLDAEDPKQTQILLRLPVAEQPQPGEGEPGALQTIERNISAMLDEIPWTCGTVGKEIYEGTEIGTYDKCAAELRDEELMLLAAGEAMPGLEVLKDLEMPLAPEKLAAQRPDTDVKK
jgi:hypothetical protein